MSLLQIISDARAAIGLGTVSAAYTSSDLNIQQLVALAQIEGDELSRFTDWRGLKTSKTFTGDGSTAMFPLPSGFDRFLAGETMWLADSPSLPLIGPVTDSEMVALKVAAATPSRPVWRMFGEKVEFYPTLASSETVKTEYYTGMWLTSSDGVTPRLRWAADSDVALVPERIITLGVIWRWKKSKGFDYAEDFRTHQVERMRAASKQAGQGVIRMRENFNQYGPVSDVRVIP